LRDRSLIQKQWDLFAESYLPIEKRDELGKELVSVLRNPTPPFPCLKRDTQCFKTNSMFQNFLTEVYFELNKKCYLKDNKSIIIQTIVDNFKGLDENINDLDELRWSLFNTEIEIDENFESEHEQDNMQESSMKKKHGIKTKKSSMKQFKLKKYRQKRRIQNDSHLKSSDNGSQKLEEERPNDAVKLFELIYKLGQNHCQMVRSYMASIQDPMDLLNEYIKLWETYVMITINFDEMFNSVSDYASEVYSEKFGDDQSNAKFPIWKLLIKAWTTEVFMPLSECLAKILCSISYDLRNKKQSHPANAFMYGKFDEDDEAQFEDRRKIVRLVQEVYNAISDLSYDETTIFFSECAMTNPQTPKRLLDSEILKNVCQLYKRDELLMKNDSTNLKNIFEDDVKFIKELFGREMKYQVLELQSAFMKTELFSVYEDALMNLNIDENEAINLRKNRVMNFKKMYSVFEIENRAEKSKVYQAKMTEGILRYCPLFEDFVEVMGHLKEAIQVENYKSKQRAMSLLQKGFNLIQEESRYPFQAGNKKPGHKGLVKAQ